MEFLCLLQNTSPDGLVSILKRRRASLDGLPPPSSNMGKQNSKRKVRFSEPEEGVEQGTVELICGASSRTEFTAAPAGTKCVLPRSNSVYHFFMSRR